MSSVAKIDKIQYIFYQLLNNRKHFRVITTGAIENVLKHKPKNINEITQAEMNQINSKLLIPVNEASVKLIIETESKFDYCLASVISDEKPNSCNPHKFKIKNSQIQLLA